MSNPSNWIWYAPNPINNTDVTDVNQTWWKIFIDENGYQLEKNNSFSGATVCNRGYNGEDYTDRSFLTRLSDLGDPDMILVFGATNDDWAGSPIGDYVWSDWTSAQLYSFRPAMAKMLSDLKARYPRAELVVMVNDMLKAIVKGSIVDICDHYGVPYLSLHDIDKKSDHPSIAGMREIANQLTDFTRGMSLGGSAVAEGDEVSLHKVANGKRTAYFKVRPGELYFKETDSYGNSRQFGIAADGSISEGEAPMIIDSEQVVRAVFDPAKGSLSILPIESMILKGAIVPDGTALQYVGGGKWESRVNLNKATGNQYVDRNFYFLINGNESLAIRRIGNSKAVGLADEGATGLENIRLNNGEYTISVDLTDYTYNIAGEIDPMRVSVFGSSVANGQGADNMHGYAWLYGEQLKERYDKGLSPNDLYTSGVSIGGNTTITLTDRYNDVIHDFGKYVIIGLSMGNEGVHETDNKRAVLNQFKNNMLALIERLRADGKVPVVVNNYTRSDFNSSDYSTIIEINRLIHEWDLPSVNSLGAIDDGAGHWSAGYIADAGHPNTAGHKEFMYAFVPSLFDALVDEKPLPERDAEQSLTLGDGVTFSLTPEGTLHPFTLCLRVKGNEPMQLVSFDHGSGRNQATSLLSVNSDGSLSYISGSKKSADISGVDVLDGKWHDIALSHYYARGLTIVYVDGKEVGSLEETIAVSGDFIIGNPDGEGSFDISEVTFWRAGMNDKEMADHTAGKMLKSSLELYSPMILEPDGSIHNRAQSTNSLKVVDTSFVKTVSEERSADDRIYNLQGMEVKQPETSLIYIRNGKKFIGR